MKYAARVLGTVVVLLAGARVAHAVPIEIVNPGFERWLLADGAFTTPMSSFLGLPGNGWTRSDTGVSAGIYNPPATVYPVTGGAPEGQNVLYNNGGGEQYVFQTLSHSLTVGTYTLQVMVGNRLDTPFPLGAIDLWAGGEQLTRTTVDDCCADAIISSDGWHDVSVVFDALPGDPQLGSLLQIRLYSTDVQINFDNVRLDGPGAAAAIAVPEPSTLLLLGSGLVVVAVAGWSRHRRKSVR